MLDAILDNIVSVTCATVTAGVLGLIALLYKKFWATAKGFKEGVLAILHDQIYRQGEFFILTNEITVDELKNLEYLHRPYHALGGNSTGDEIFEKCRELPVVDRRTKYNPYYTQRLKGEE